jgi:2-polyprenyl-3-methyl-5-hydroxy-6-metoxy-1,4-benzoquinol methylase
MLEVRAGDCSRTCCEPGISDVRLRFERAVLGSDYGADGWTTREQADKLGEHVELVPGQRLLDLGCGRGSISR